VAVIATVGVLAAVVAIGLPPALRRSDVLLRDDFESDRGWSTDEDPLVTMRFANGGYEILVKDHSVSQESRHWLSGPLEREISFSAEATVVRGPLDAAIGLVCYSAQRAGYVFGITRSGNYEIVRASPSDVDFHKGLTKGTTEPLAHGVNRLSISCIGGATAPTILTFTVNGESVARVEDPGGWDGFGAVGFWVWSSEDDALFRFDNALAERTGAR
jgi:hypothetical protein